MSDSSDPTAPSGADPDDGPPPEVGRTTVTRVPYNAQTDLAALREPRTPTGAFYVRSNFPAPEIDPDHWRLTVAGEVRRPGTLSLEQVRGLAPAETRLVTLECAGNGRTLLRPTVPGTAWTLGATGTAAFTGVPLHALLDRADPEADVAEVLFTGADRGAMDGWGEVAFQRALPLADARARKNGPLLAWAMNGEALPRDHGAPLRLVVPGWYAVASVKWLTEIRLLRHPFRGCFQTDRYRYLVPGREPEPVRRMRVRSLILDPLGGDVLPAGQATVSGTAWSGHGRIAGVRVSTDGGATWRGAAVDPSPAPFTPSRWTLVWEATPGAHELVARARDAAGHEQPLTPWWNELGYGNNQVHRVRVTVRG